MMKQLIAIVLFLSLAMTVMAQDTETSEEMTVHIGPYLQDCVGVAPQECMIVRFEDEDELSYFYDNIEGFEFEEGFEYTLLVNVTEVDNPPADASSLQYELVEIVQQLPAQLGNKVWELQSLYGEEIAEPSRYTFQVVEDATGLKADCNSVGANVTINPFDIETTFSTLVACPEDSLEMPYVEAMNAVTMMSIENGELILQSSEGQLRFAPPSIEGTEWNLTRVLSMSMMFELDETVPYTLQIEDGMVSMTIVCNAAGGEVEIDGAVLRFGEIESQLALCEDDPLMGDFPPETAVYYITNEGKLVLEDDATRLFEFTSDTSD